MIGTSNIDIPVENSERLVCLFLLGECLGELAALSLEDEMGNLMRNLNYHQDRGKSNFLYC